MLNQNEKKRYTRNILIPEINEEGQEKLINSRVLVVGAGGLGSAIIFYLASSGVGTIAVADNDIVELSNLQRQIIHNELDIGIAKVESAKNKIKLLNSTTNFIALKQEITKDNLVLIANEYDIIIDASDNFNTRFIINEICHCLKKPLIFGAVKQFQGQTTIFKSFINNNPCYACFNHNQDSTKLEIPISEKGILGAVAGTIGSIQAINAIKEILGIGESMVGKMLISNFFTNNFKIIKINKNPLCKICNQ
jgi:molybdopterin/thiamine biosynthesis adenylyltransferase